MYDCLRYLGSYWSEDVTIFDILGNFPLECEEKVNEVLATRLRSAMEAIEEPGSPCNCEIIDSDSVLPQYAPHFSNSVIILAPALTAQTLLSRSNQSFQKHVK